MRPFQKQEPEVCRLGFIMFLVFDLRAMDLSIQMPGVLDPSRKITRRIRRRRGMGRRGGLVVAAAAAAAAAAGEA